MSFSGYYKLASYVLIASGFLALALSGFVSLVPLTIFAGALLTSWFIDTARLHRALPHWLWTAAALALILLWYVDFRLFSHSLLLSTLPVIMILAAIKLLTRTSDRDYLYLYMLSFGSLLAAAALTVQIMFLPCLLLFLASGISSLILFEMNRSSTRALVGGMIRPVYVPKNLRGTGLELFAGFPSRSMAALTLALTIAVCALAVPLFYLLPRTSLGVLHPPSASRGLTSGFTERVELGAFGRIKQSSALVMKVQIDARGGRPPRDPKWRGVALEQFDGRSWSRPRLDRTPVPRQTGYFKLQQAALGADIVVQTFFLQPMATDVVFGSHRILAVSADLGWLARDPADNIYSFTPRDRALSYSVISDVTQPDLELIPAGEVTLPGEIAGFCLQVPPLDPRIGALARRLTAQAGTAYEKALALESYLRANYAYSLDLEDTSGSTGPLAGFLFDIRRGHCEYFASALAVMLRQSGIPARLVNGFRAGQYNSISGHWTVRQRDAHSWVEAWIAPYGWMEFDPTPPESPTRTPALLGILASLWDALDFWWTDDIVNFDIRKQSRFVQAARAALQGMRGSLRAWTAQAAAVGAGTRLARWMSSPWAISVVLPVLLLTVALLLQRPSAWWRRQRRRLAQGRFRKDPVMAVSCFYADALEALQARGWERRPGQTPIEFAGELKNQPCGPALDSLTRIYNRVRFGRIAEESDWLNARSLLATLRRLPRRGSAGP